MKAIKLLIVLMMVVSTAYSQTSLSPKKKIIEGSDTLRCWNVKQSKAIAKIIKKEALSDSLITALDSSNQDLQRSADFYADLYANSQLQIENLKVAVKDQKTISENKDVIIEDKKKEVKKQKLQKWLAILGMGGSIALSILR